MENLNELMKKYPISDIPEKDMRDLDYSDVCATSKAKENFPLVNPEWKYPILNQNPYGMCQAYSLVEQSSAIKGLPYNEKEMFSTGWLYYYRPDGYSQGVGLGTNDGFKTCTKVGLIKEKDFSAKNGNYPTGKECINDSNRDTLLELANSNKMEAYVEIDPEDVAEFMYNHDNNPMNLVILCYENFYECLKTGEFPCYGEGKKIGAHAVTLKGLALENGHVYGYTVNHWGLENGFNGIFKIRMDSPTIYSIKGFIDKREIIKEPDKSKGWTKVNINGITKWKYSEDGNTYVKDKWIQDKGKWYYIGSDELMLTEWFKDLEGYWYYLDIDKGYAYTGWVYINGNWYYFDSNCKMLKGWQYIDGEWFYLRDTKESDDKPEGSMYIGWKLSQDCSKWYYMNKKGICVHDCTLNIDGKTYSFNSDGAMQEFVCLVTREQLNQVGWYNKYITDSMLVDLNNCLQRFNITTPARIRHFISQCSHESGCGYYMVEEASGRAYEYRKDLGNIYSGDGVKYKGAGYIQLTGRANYQSLANYLGDQNVMDGAYYVANNYPWTSAGYWWYKNNMNSLCDSGADCLAITKRVNGGTNGYKDRLMYYNKCCNIF